MLISRDGIGWKVKLTIRLNDHVLRVQPNKAKINEIDYGRWNEWDGLWTERNKNETWSISVGWKKWDETCGMKEMRWNMGTEENEMKHEQWSW